MKSDREYFDELWKIAAKLEVEERQKRAARVKNRRLFLRSILVYGALGILFLFLCSIPFAGLQYLQAACAAFLTIGFAADSMLSRHN